MRTLTLLTCALLATCSVDAFCNTINFQTCLTTFNTAVGMTGMLNDWSNSVVFLNSIMLKIASSTHVADLSTTCAIYDALAQCAANTNDGSTLESCTVYTQLSLYKVTGVDKYRITGGLNAYNFICNGAQASNTNAMWETCLSPVLSAQPKTAHLNNPNAPTAAPITQTAVNEWMGAINSAYDAFAQGLAPGDIDLLMNITAEAGAHRFLAAYGGKPQCCACYTSVPYVWGCQFVVIASGLTLNPAYAPNYACPDRVPVADGDCVADADTCDTP